MKKLNISLGLESVKRLENKEQIMTDEELAEEYEEEEMLREEQERELLYEELMMQNYDFEYGDVIY